jgi:hypothetical protein
MYPRLGPSTHGEKWSVQARLLDEDVSPQLLQALVSPRGEGHGGGARLAGCPRSGCARWVSLLADPDVCGAHSALQEPSLGALARVITAGACREARCTRGKGEAGMDADQVRTWEGWHPHRALTLIGVWCVIEDTHRGRQWTPALTLPHGRSGVRVLLMAMCCARSLPSICRHVQHPCRRHAWARFSPHATPHYGPPRQGRRDLQEGYRSGCTQAP